MSKKEHEIFISHSSEDKEYAKAIVDLLEGMGIPKDKIFCSSVPGYDIPNGETIFDYLKEKFVEYSLHVLFIHSSNYYKSHVCLNEMGATWGLQHSYTSILLPGFSFNEMDGVVNNQKVAIKLDNPDENDLRNKLNQLKNTLANEFGFQEPKDDINWERKRDSFIENVGEISEKEKAERASTDLQIQQETENRADSFFIEKQNQNIESPEKLFQIGRNYHLGENGVEQNDKKAFEYWEKAAEQGFAGAQCNLGNCYKNGQGVRQDYYEAVKWYEKAAEQGHAGAQCSLGFCYYHGQGVKQDYSEAVKWCKEAAEQGYAAAQYNLGICYKNGQGVGQDYLEAVKWYEKAAKQGYISTKNKLKIILDFAMGIASKCEF